MNNYTRHHISRFHEKYLNKVFDQDDVTLFVVLARDYMPMNSIFRELGDFLAHPDKKDRGLVISSFLPVIDFFEENTDLVMSGEDIDIKRPNGLGLLEEVQDNLSSVFKLVNLACPVGDRNELSFRDFIFCLIFILGNCKLQIKGKCYDLKVIYGHSLELNISYESSKYTRNFISMNALFLGNVWIQNGSFYKKELRNHITRRFDNGCLGAIPYELDTLNLCPDMSSFQRDVVWPLPIYN
ncbi:hypothetical protein BVY04_05315 [bacterium M21]|nr:hypothetical protein BVY04_05315 [bacterium M21]